MTVSTADHVLDQIDSALHDWSVSDDAMRSRPEPEPISFGGFTPTVQIMDEAGEWQDLGVTTVEIHITEPPEFADFARQWADFIDRMHRQRVEHVRRVEEAFEAFGQALAHSVQPAAEQAAHSFEVLQQTMERDPQRAPKPRRDRPAWQTPYGPARRRR
jgi:hypothetical protein